MTNRICDMAEKMRLGLPGRYVKHHRNSEKFWLMHQMLKEGVHIQEDMIWALAKDRKYILWSYERVDKDPKIRLQVKKRIRQQLTEMFKYWEEEGILCKISEGPSFIRPSEGNDFYEIFYTKIERII